MLGYRIPKANQAMLISGGRGGGDTAVKVVVGRGKFVPPVVRKVGFLDLSMNESEISEECYTKQGIPVTVKAIIAFKVAPDPESIAKAGERFLDDRGTQMTNLIGRIFATHLRSIVGSMTVEEIVQERQRLAQEVVDASKIEVEKLGLLVDAFGIEGFRDSTGYIDNMQAQHVANIKRDAKIAQARAEQDAAKTEQESKRQQAEFTRQTSIATAQYDAEVEAERAKASQSARIAQADAQREIQRAEAEAAQSGPLAAAKAQQQVTDEQTVLANKAAELRAQQLRAEQVEPAKASAAARVEQAKAEAEAQRLAAEAAEAGNRVSLDQLMIEQLPAVAQALAEGLKGANVNVLNGADGLSEVVTGLLAQGGAIFNSMRQIHTGASTPLPKTTHSTPPPFQEIR